MLSQLLDPTDAPTSAGDVVRHLFAVQAQDHPAARLGIRVRSKDLTADDVERERVEDRSFVRTWVMRGTIHLVSSEDLDWVRELVAPQLMPNAFRRMAREGWQRDDAERAGKLLLKMLEGGPMPRARIRAALPEKGVPAAGRQALTHLLWLMAYRGHIVTGPYHGAKETAVLARDWIPAPGHGPEHPAAELARRYVIGHGPASFEDFERWSGLRRGEAREGWRAIGDELVEERLGSVTLWRHRSHPREPGRSRPVRMLPAFDAMFLGYRDRSYLGPAADLSDGGLIHPFVMTTSGAAARWSLGRHGEGYDVRIERVEGAPLPGRAVLEREVSDIGRFLGGEAALRADSTP